ncbi:hypothetical protein ABD77_18670 [Brevibacillus formosus]|nr:hypothetical protein [Brevibacillus formosus]
MVAASSRGHGCVSFARKSLLRLVGLHKSLRLEIFFSVVTDEILQAFKAFKTRLKRKARRGNRRKKRRSLVHRPRRNEKKRNKLLASTSEEHPEWATLDAGFAFFHGAGQ